MPLLGLSDVQLYWEQTGSGSPVVFINGIMMSARSWRPQVEAIGARFRCINYDLRGQLMSGKPAGDYRFERHTADLLALFDALDLRQAHLVGISYGGAVGQLFAARHPERVRSLSLIATTAESGAEHRRRFQHWLSVLATQPRELFAHSLRQN